MRVNLSTTLIGSFKLLSHQWCDDYKPVLGHNGDWWVSYIVIKLYCHTKTKWYIAVLIYLLLYSIHTFGADLIDIVYWTRYRTFMHLKCCPLYADDNSVALTAILLEMVMVRFKNLSCLYFWKLWWWEVLMKCSNLLRMKAGRKVKTWQHKFCLKWFYTGDSNFNWCL